MAQPGAAWQATDVVRTPTLVWRAVLDQAIMEPSALLRAIDEGKVDDDPKYAF